MGKQNRRSFLATVGAFGTAFASRGMAMKPIERVGKTSLRVSLAGYSLRQYLQRPKGIPGSIDLLTFADYAADLGLDAVEPTSYYFPSQDPADFAHKLKRRCHILGLDVSGGAIRNNFTLSPGDALDQCFKDVEKWIDVYAELGAPVIRVFGGKPPKGISTEQAVKNCIVNLEKACEMAGKRGIMLGLENHDFLCDVSPMLEIVEGVQSPWFGVNFDSGNFHSNDPYSDLEKIAPYTVNAQIKAEIRGRDGKREEADFDRIVSILLNAGYRGYAVLEYEAAVDPYEGIPTYVEKLRRAIVQESRAM